MAVMHLVCKLPKLRKKKKKLTTSRVSVLQANNIEQFTDECMNNTRVFQPHLIFKHNLFLYLFFWSSGTSSFANTEFILVMLAAVEKHLFTQIIKTLASL